MRPRLAVTETAFAFALWLIVAVVIAGFVHGERKPAVPLPRIVEERDLP